jgi:two-component system chemotaxis sensor kinase CheA
MEAQLERMLGAEPRAEAASAPAQSAASEVLGAGWRIRFRPFRHLMHSGNDPLRMFRALAELGTLAVRADLGALPETDDMAPEDAYMAWDLELAGDASREAVDEVFAWVDGDCDLSIEPLTPDTAQPEPSPEPPAATATPGSSKTLDGELVFERRKGDRRTRDRRSGGLGGDSGSIRVGIDKVDSLINLVGELVTTQSMLSAIGEDFDMSRLDQLTETIDEVERNTRDLQESVMRIRMLPVAFVFNRFPRLAHDLGEKLGKKVQLELHGEQTELDKTVIEQIGDPLVHIVRNSLDHGLESPEERVAAGKPEVGTVRMEAYHQGGSIYIQVSDDGRGLDKARLRKKAVDLGMANPDDPIPDEQLYELVFAPGVSTAESVSDLSGRGVGMDVVRRNIQSLGGSVTISSEAGKGTVICVRLPLTLAILEGQLVSVGGDRYVIPLVSIIESVQVREAQVNRVASGGEVYLFRGEYLNVVRLARLFDSVRAGGETGSGILVIVEAEGRKVGLLIDDLLGQQQVAIKSLEENYRRVEGVAGATIMGDGRVALILDVPGLVRIDARR